MIRYAGLARRLAATLEERPAVLAAGFGCVAGAGFGFPGSGVLTVLMVAALAAVLSRPALTPGDAARTLAAFVALLFATAEAGAALALPGDVRILGLLPWACGVATNTAVAMAFGAITFACRVPLAVRLTLVLPSLWVLQEWLLGLPAWSIPWVRLGYAQAGAGSPLAGALPYGGVLLASWLTVALGGLSALAWRGRAGTWRVPVAVAASLVGGSVALGGVEWTVDNGPLQVRLVQAPAVSSDAVPPLLAGALRDGHAGLVVTPQLAVPRSLSAWPEPALAGVADALESQQADALIGLYLRRPDGAAWSNGVIGIGRSGPQVYLKQHLFPFGEFLPLPASAAAWLQSRLPARLAPLAAGPATHEPLRVAGHRAAIAICYDAVFPDTWNAQAGTADLLVQVSSDSALASAQLARQWRQLAQARAQEMQKPLVRTSDVRGTWVVAATGRVEGEQTEGVAGVLEATIHTRAGVTPYARWGDRVVLVCITMALGAAALLAMAAGRRPAPPSFKPSASPAHRHAGQVLPAAVVLLLVVSAMFYFMVNAGQAVTEKIRLTNAADAAAYSAAIAEARALNHDAYLNRAIVANEIAIAQLLSYASWARYFATASDQFAANAADINFFLLPEPKVAVLDAAFGGSAAVAAYLGGRSVSEYADYIVDAAGVLIAAHDLAVRALALSQQAVHAQLAVGVRQQQIAQRVVQAMDPTLHAEVVPVTHEFEAFTRAYARAGSAGDERARLADVVTRSRDPFTRERDWTVTSFSIPLVRSEPALKKRGGTDLVGFDEWRAVDTLELHGRTWGCGKWGLSWCDDIQRPIGWSAAMVSADGADAGRGLHGNAYVDNPATAARAESSMHTPLGPAFSGLPDSRDLADTDPASRATTGITVRAAKAHADTLTAGNAAQARPGGRLALFDARPASGELVALSRAEVYFDRIAARADGQVERGSLYNPYWRVRLVAPTADDRAYAAALQGGLGLP